MGVRGTGVAGIFPLPSLPSLAASNPSSAGPRARGLGQRAVFHGWFLCDPGLLFIGLGGCSGLILSWEFFPMENPHWKLCDERDKSACSLSPPELNPYHLLFNNYYVFCHRWFYVNIAVPFYSGFNEDYLSLNSSQHLEISGWYSVKHSTCTLLLREDRILGFQPVSSQPQFLCSWSSCCTLWLIFWE